ncbi:MAG: very short patch repair endonuclease, partial [Candidatus Zixiibacteriota bacterium]
MVRRKSAAKKAKSRPRKIVSKAMSAVKAKNTSPELALRKALWARGYRYRLHDSRLPGKPDLVMATRRVALFIDGDYWHGRQWKKRGFSSLEEQMKRVNNSDYWIKKITGNIERDKKHTRSLRSKGWRVIRICESDLK